MENRFLRAEEVLKDAKSIAAIAGAKVEQKREKEKATWVEKTPAAFKLDQLRKDCEQVREEARQEFKNAYFRKKYYRILMDLTAKTTEQVLTRHWQRTVVGWALEELDLIKEEVRKLPESSDIPMIVAAKLAAVKRGRKRARFTNDEPSIRLISPSGKGRKIKRRKLALNQYPFPQGNRSLSSKLSIAERLEWASLSGHDVWPAPTDGGNNDEQEGEDERPIVTGESSGQDKQPSASEHEPIDNGSTNVQQEEDGGGQSATGESSGQGAAAEASSSYPTSRPEYQATLSPIQPDADEDDPTGRQGTPPASGGGDGQHVPQGVGSEQPAVTAEVPAPATASPSPKARESQPPRRSARIMAKLAEQATAPTDESAARNAAEPQAQLKGKGKAKRALSAPATLDADEPRPKRRRRPTAKQANTAHGSAAGQGTSSSDGPGLHVPQEEGTIQDCITISSSSLDTGPPTAHGSQRARPRKRATSRVNRSKRKA
ncbi:hypothetical protein V2G26_007911 [Clonostachys chloroleuca]